jgi:hypothetical protein
MPRLDIEFRLQFNDQFSGHPTENATISGFRLVSCIYFGLVSLIVGQQCILSVLRFHRTG